MYKYKKNNAAKWIVVRILFFTKKSMHSAAGILNACILIKQHNEKCNLNNLKKKLIPRITKKYIFA